MEKIEDKEKNTEIKNTETVTFKNTRGLSLVGDFFYVKNSPIVVMVHGLTGDRHEGGRFDQTAAEFQKEGFNIFRFDFSGCGESDDDSLTEEKQIDDLRSALKLVTEKGFDNIVLLGLSFGGLISARVFDDRIKTIILWAPVTNTAINSEDYYGPEAVRELQERGSITRIRSKVKRQQVVISEKLFQEWKKIDQQELLSRISVPVLIIHGDQDNRVSLVDSQKAMRYLPNGSRLEVIKGADHIFNDYVKEFITTSVVWLKSHTN